MTMDIVKNVVETRDFSVFVSFRKWSRLNQWKPHDELTTFLIRVWRSGRLIEIHTFESHQICIRYNWRENLPTKYRTKNWKLVYLTPAIHFTNFVVFWIWDTLSYYLLKFSFKECHCNMPSIFKMKIVESSIVSKKNTHFSNEIQSKLQND